MPKRVQGAKIACLDFNLMKTKMKLGVQVYNLLNFLLNFLGPRGQPREVGCYPPARVGYYQGAY